MAKEDIEVSYDKEHDILSLSKIGKKSKFSFDIELPKGDFVIDYGFDSMVVGIEFFNASNYFPFLKKVKPEKLRGRLSAQYGSDWVQISFVVYAPGIKKPEEQSIISPYNKKLILEH